jgi:hypothetical protein
MLIWDCCAPDGGTATLIGQTHKTDDAGTASDPPDLLPGSRRGGAGAALSGASNRKSQACSEST